MPDVGSGAPRVPGGGARQWQHLRLLGRTMVALASLAVLAATLFPTRSSGSPGPFDCLICGERGLADALLNVVLFVPLGATLALHRRARTPLALVLLYAGLLSSSVELAQLFVPGRDASPGDLVFNLSGALLGVTLVRSAPAWVAPRAAVSARLSLAAAGLVALGFGATGALLEPVFPASTYFVQWTPDLAHLERYDGRVLRARLGAEDLPPRPLPDARSFSDAFRSGRELRVEAVAGAPVPALAPLLSIHDDRRREILLLGPDGGDLVFRYRTRAADYRLDRPALRVAGAHRRLREGEAFSVGIRGVPRGFCIGVDREPVCSYGFTLGEGWMLLLAAAGRTAGRRAFLAGLWLVLLAVPVGYWVRGRWESLAGLGVLFGALGLVPGATGLEATPAVQFACVALGVGVGAGLGAIARLDPARRGREVRRP